jgi:hypothetical protein
MSKFIITKQSTIPQYDYDIQNCNVPSYSKLLNINIVGNEMNIIFESPTVGTNNDTKVFSFKVITGLYQNNTFIDNRFIYHDTIRVQESDFIEYYHIFYDEIKSPDELRDDKLQEIISDEDF